MSNSFEFQGILCFKGNTVQVSDSFSKREFAIEVPDENHPQYFSMQLLKDNCSKLDNIKEGDFIKVQYNLSGRKWINKEGEAKYFNSLTAWKIELISSANNADSDNPYANAPVVDEDDDAPF